MKTWLLIAVLVLTNACSSESSPVPTDTEDLGLFALSTDEAGEIPMVERDTILDLFNVRHQLRITGFAADEAGWSKRYYIELENEDGIVLDTVIRKTSFRDSLDVEFLHRAGLYKLDFDFVRSNSLYFNAYVGVGETDSVMLMGMLIRYQGPNKGRINYWVKDDGSSTGD